MHYMMAYNIRRDIDCSGVFKGCSMQPWANCLAQSTPPLRSTHLMSYVRDRCLVQILRGVLNGTHTANRLDCRQGHFQRQYHLIYPRVDESM